MHPSGFHRKQNKGNTWLDTNRTHRKGPIITRCDALFHVRGSHNNNNEADERVAAVVLFPTVNDSTQEKGLKAFLFRGQRDISRPSLLPFCNAAQELLCPNPSFKITKSAREANYPPQTTSPKIASCDQYLGEELD